MEKNKDYAAAIESANKQAEASALKMGESSWYEDFRVVKSDWVKNGKNRTYYEMHGYSNGNLQKKYKVGYVNNLTGEFVKQW